MSVHITSAVWKLAGMNPAVKLVLLKLADHANDEGICYPSIRRIVAETGISRSQVFAHLRFLREIEVVTSENRFSEDGRQTSNLFRIRTERWEGEGPKSGRGGGSEIRTGGVRNPDGGGSVNRTPMNHQYEPPKEHTPPPPQGGELFALDAVAKEPKPDVDAQVESLYQAYPRKVDRGHAVKAIRTALRKAPFDELLLAVQNYARDAAGAIAAGRLKKELVPYPATWFNGERWKDEKSQSQQDTKYDWNRKNW